CRSPSNWRCRHHDSGRRLMRVPVALWPLAGLLFFGPAPAYAVPECLANGHSFAIGQTACLNLAGKEHLARCEMVLNNTSWTKVGEDCAAPQSDEKPVQKPAQSGQKPAEPAAN